MGKMQGACEDRGLSGRMERQMEGDRGGGPIVGPGTEREVQGLAGASRPISGAGRWGATDDPTPGAC